MDLLFRNVEFYMQKIYGGLIDIKGKNFLVIGGAGLIGSHAVDKLLKRRCF